MRDLQLVGQQEQQFNNRGLTMKYSFIFIMFFSSFAFSSQSFLWEECTKVQIECLDFTSTPDPEPVPEPEPVTPIFEGSSNGSAVVVAHDDAHIISDGVIEFDVTPSAIGPRQGLVSKDAGGFGSGGHFTASMINDDLEIRLQSPTAEGNVRADNIFVADESVNIKVIFGASGLSLQVNDVEVDSSPDWTGGLEGNREPWVIGALQWASSNESSDVIQYPLTGIVSLRLWLTAVITPTELVSVDLTWLPASLRTDDSELSIASHRVHYKKDSDTNYQSEVADSANGHSLELESGSYEFYVITVDDEGRRSQPSDLVSLSF